MNLFTGSAAERSRRVDLESLFNFPESFFESHFLKLPYAQAKRPDVLTQGVFKENKYLVRKN